MPQSDGERMTAELERLMDLIEQPRFHTLTFEETEVSIIVLALAELALERPGWEPCAILPIVDKFAARGLYVKLKAANADRFNESRRPMDPLTGL